MSVRWLAVAVCLWSGDAGSPPAEPAPVHGRLEAGYVQLGNAPHPDRAWYDDKARYDYILLSEGAWNVGRMAGAADSLRARNAGLRVGGYFNVMALGRWVVRQVDAGAAPGSWAYEFYHAVTPYLARTNAIDPATGQPDTAAIFRNDYCINILDPAARAAIIRLYTDPGYLGPVDWFFLDFLTVPLPDLKAHQEPIYRELEHGDLDLDRDGVGHWEDADEQRALRDAFAAYVRELRAALPAHPERFLLIANGRLCTTDDDIAALVDGVYVEGFPMWNFGSRAADFAGAFDAGRVPSLWSLTRPRYRGGVGVVMIEDRFGHGQLGHVAGLFDGCVEVQRLRGEGVVRDATRALRWLGAPAGPARPDGAVVIRPFEHGVLRVEIVSPGRIDVAAERRP